MKKILLLILIAFLSKAQVNLDKSILIEEIRLFEDIKLKNVLYFTPNGIEIAKDRDGLPDFKLILMRYTGKRLSEDQQKKVFKNIVQFKVVTKYPATETLNRIKNQLDKSIELRRIPLQKIATYLIYTPIVSNEKNSINEAESENNATKDEQFFSLALANEDAQLLIKSIQQNQSLISIGFSCWVDGKSTDNQEVIDIKGKTNESFKQYLDSLSGKFFNKIAIVSAGASPIEFSQNHEKFINKIDINEQLPAEFATLEIRCYDFNNELRNGIYAKKIEIEAISIDGIPVSSQTIFYKKNPDIYLKKIKFNYAIKMDAPIRYRITEIDLEGKSFIKGWIKKEDWSMIDITN